MNAKGESGGEKKLKQGEVRVEGSCGVVAGCPLCALLRAGTESLKPAVLAGEAEACAAGDSQCVANIFLQRPSATDSLFLLYLFLDCYYYCLKGKFSISQVGTCAVVTRNQYVTSCRDLSLENGR